MASSARQKTGARHRFPRHPAAQDGRIRGAREPPLRRRDPEYPCHHPFELRRKRAGRPRPEARCARLPDQVGDDARQSKSRRSGLGQGIDRLVPNRDARIGGAFDLDKPLYTISVASEILETHPRTLMMYEDLCLIEPYRTATNRRRYSQRNVRKLQVIQQLTREKGVNLAGGKYSLMLLESLKRGGG